MRHCNAFSIRSRMLCSQRVTFCLALTIAFWLVLVSANVAQALNVTPSGMSFVAVEGGPNPPTQSFTITASGSTPEAWFASGGGSWFQVVPHAGTMPGSAFVSANVAGLTAGTYTGTILITSRQTGTSRVVTVLLTVTPQNIPSQ